MSSQRTISRLKVRFLPRSPYPQQLSYCTHSALWGLLWGPPGAAAARAALPRFRSFTALRICSRPGCWYFIAVCTSACPSMGRCRCRRKVTILRPVYHRCRLPGQRSALGQESGRPLPRGSQWQCTSCPFVDSAYCPRCAFAFADSSEHLFTLRAGAGPGRGCCAGPW